MSKTMITSYYSIYMIDHISKSRIISIIENRLGLIATNTLGSNDSYSIVFKNPHGDYVGTLDVDTLEENGIEITKITEKVEAEEVYGKEVNKRDCVLFITLYEVLKGLLICKKYKTVDYSQLTDTSYIITYDKESLEYKLTELLINEIGDPRKTLAFVQILKNKKKDLIDILA